MDSRGHPLLGAVEGRLLEQLLEAMDTYMARQRTLCGLASDEDQLPEDLDFAALEQELTAEAI